MKKLMMAAFLLLGMAVGVQAAEETNPRIASVYISTTGAPSSLAVTGAGVIYGVVLSTGGTSNYCVFRDTATVNTSSTAMLPRIHFTSTPQVIQFATPIRFSNGLSVNNGYAAGAGSDECAILYRKGRLW